MNKKLLLTAGVAIAGIFAVNKFMSSNGEEETNAGSGSSSSGYLTGGISEEGYLAGEAQREVKDQRTINYNIDAGVGEDVFGTMQKEEADEEIDEEKRRERKNRRLMSLVPKKDDGEIDASKVLGEEEASKTNVSEITEFVANEFPKAKTPVKVKSRQSKMEEEELKGDIWKDATGSNLWGN